MEKQPSESVLSAIRCLRSDCAVSFALDTIGDKWTLLIVRDLLEGKKTFQEFLNSGEGIATNLLSDRLKRLEVMGIITKTISQKDGRSATYALTPKGMELKRVVSLLGEWSTKHYTGLRRPI